MPLIPSLSAEYSHKKLEMYSEQNKYADFRLFVFGQKEIEKLFKKDIFKVIMRNKVVISEEIPSSIKDFNSYFFDDIRDLYINKACKRSCLIMHAYNDKKKNIVLEHLSKILEVS